MSFPTKEAVRQEIKSFRTKYKGAHPELLSQIGVLSVMRSYVSSSSLLEFIIKAPAGVEAGSNNRTAAKLSKMTRSLWKPDNLAALKVYTRPFSVQNHPQSGTILVDANGLPILINADSSVVERIIDEENSR